MKVKEIIITEKEKEIDIKDITLLSIGEYLLYKDLIPLIKEWWWLRSPGYFSNYTTGVDHKGNIDYKGYSVYVSEYAVRPVLIYESDNLKVKNKIIFAGLTWTIISNNMALCDEIVEHTCFRKDYKEDNVNDYESSDIKEWLHNWLKEKIENAPSY